MGAAQPCHQRDRDVPRVDAARASVSLSTKECNLPLAQQAIAYSSQTCFSWRCRYSENYIISILTIKGYADIWHMLKKESVHSVSN